MPTLDWIGKNKVINHHQDVPYQILEWQYSYDISGQHEEDNGSENMVIHGDNLVALKSLLPKYEGRIKCIYIDPPYNTAKSSEKNKAWVYSDNVDDPRIQKWMNETVGDEGEDLARHDKWLCMMYPRLKLLQRLLSHNGVVFISIDDNELENLIQICNEIFMAKNHVATFIWYTNGHTDNQDPITNVHEYILCYAQNKNELNINNVVDPNVKENSKILNSFAENSITKNGSKNPPSIVELPIGFPCEVESLFKDQHGNLQLLMGEVSNSRYITREMTKKYSISYPARLDEMIIENFALVRPCRVYSGWMNKEKLERFIQNGCQPIQDGDTLLRFYLSKNGVIYYRRDDRNKHYVQTVLENMGTTETNKYMLENIGIIFDYPKPYTLIEYIISLYSNDNDIVLDSFAGSGTTAHAVLNMNKADGGNRKFILIEMMDYADSITAERVKRVINGSGSGKQSVEGIGGDFSYYELGEPMLIGEHLNENVGIDKIREYIWYTETKRPFLYEENGNPYYLGDDNQTAYYFYYGPDTICTLDYSFMATIPTKADGYVIYADRCALSSQELLRLNITFKKITRDITRM